MTDKDWAILKNSSAESVYNINKCLLSNEGIEIGFAPPEYLNDLLKKLNNYMTQWIKNNSKVIEKFDIKNEVPNFKYKLPKCKDKLNWKSYYLIIAVLSCDYKKVKEYFKETKKNNLLAKDLNLNFVYEYKKEKFIISQRPCYSHGNKRISYMLMNDKNTHCYG